MADFDIAVEIVLRHEGGFVDDPADPGGATKFGISPRWLDAMSLKDNVRELKQERAVMLYREHFWEPYAFQHWPEQDLATKVFDATVNMGPAQAMKCFQRSLRACGQSQVLDDGVYGPVTMRAKLTALDEYGDGVLTATRSELAAFYRVLTTVRPASAKFLDGWLRRAYDEQ